MRSHSNVLPIGFTTLLMMAGAVVTAFAQDFALQVGPPIAGKTPQAKSSVFVVRPGGCADPAGANITATAEGIVDGARRMVPLKVAALPTPGVRAVSKEWPNGGLWIVNVVGTCDGKTAAAIVSMGPRDTYKRESVKLLAHRPTDAEIAASLKELSAGGQK